MIPEIYSETLWEGNIMGKKIGRTQIKQNELAMS